MDDGELTRLQEAHRALDTILTHAVVGEPLDAALAKCQGDRLESLRLVLAPYAQKRREYEPEVQNLLAKARAGDATAKATIIEYARLLRDEPTPLFKTAPRRRSRFGGLFV